jgi:hypothetical protein
LQKHRKFISPEKEFSMPKHLTAFGLISLAAATVWLTSQLIQPTAPEPSGDVALPSAESEQGDGNALSVVDSQTDQSKSSPADAPTRTQPDIQSLWTPNSGASQATFALDVSLDSLAPGSESKIVLSSGSEYLMHVLSASQEQEILQINANVIDEGYRGFALITQHDDLVVGTFNTPEGVFELYGSSNALSIRRAGEVDGARRSGVDYRVSKASEALDIPSKKLLARDP